MTESTSFHVHGTVNFRDVGGYATPTGLTRRGRLFRSDALGRLGESGRAELERLDIGTIIDLRDGFERKAMPDDVAGMAVERIDLPVFEGAAASQGTLTQTLAGLYELILTEHAGVIATAIRTVARSDSPVLIHCTAGKDRTGVIVALALTAVGVSRDDVLSDYSRSEDNLRGQWLEGMMAFIAERGGKDTPDLRVLLGGSPPEAMAAALDLVDARWGGAQQYLLDAGVSQLELASLQSVLITTDA